MLAHKCDEGSNLIYIHLSSLLPILPIVSVNFLSLGSICYYTASSGTLFWLRLLHATIKCTKKSNFFWTKTDVKLVLLGES